VIFGLKIYHLATLHFCDFQTTAQSKPSTERRNFTQSGHPAPSRFTGFLDRKFKLGFIPFRTFSLDLCNDWRQKFCLNTDLLGDRKRCYDHSIRQFSAIFGGFRRFSAIFGDFRRFSAIFGDFRRFSAIFANFRQFSAKKSAFLFKIDVAIKMFPNLTLFLTKNANLFATLFGENIFEIITSAPA
jgi:hypothetical protein